MSQHRDSIRTVTSSDFASQVLNGQGPIVVEFMSYGCSHCRAMEPVIQEVAASLASKEQIFRVNVAAEQGLAAAYAIEATPTLVMFRNGAEVGRVEGPHPTVPALTAAVTQPFASSRHGASIRRC